MTLIFFRSLHNEKQRTYSKSVDTWQYSLRNHAVVRQLLLGFSLVLAKREKTEKLSEVEMREKKFRIYTSTSRGN